jgi:hypothetical protein
LRRDLIETRLFDAAQDDIGRVPEAFFGLAQFIVQVGDALATPVLQFHPLRILLLGPGVPAVGPAVLGTDGALSQGAASGVGLLRLLPYFALDENYRYKTINAKAETVSQLPSFREPFRLSAVLCRLRGFMNQIKYIMQSLRFHGIIFN